MAARKTNRTNKASDKRSLTSDTTSRVRNSEVVKRSDLPAGADEEDFESDAPGEEEPAVVVLPHIVISESNLDDSMQDDTEFIASNAMRGNAADVPREPFLTDVDLTQPTTTAASLFDQVVPDDELDEAELDDVPVEGVTMAPTLHTEDPSEFEEEREREIRRVRHELLKKRQHAEHATPTQRGHK
jgi:hypothetical protein